MPRNASPAAAQIGSRIAMLRKTASMTVDQLAVATKIDSSNIRSYESGRAMMNVRSLVRIACALDVDPGTLLKRLPRRCSTGNPAGLLVQMRSPSRRRGPFA
ncbi:helix-turn-helix domain-containing protein [Microbacterium sp. MMO-10]|uniref:helix-turn-helix domain-containing protein n=1 Tax=Microbacterium sp. MMO-10 TaxID=3081272 RepID=UPI003FA5EF5C